MVEARKARAVGFNHVALEVGDIEEGFLRSIVRFQTSRQEQHFGLHRSGRPIPRTTDFLDPWGNRIEIVSYDNVQFTKAPNVLRGMGLTHLSKNEQALKELTAKGMEPS